ncbi:hypothetical protein FA554_21970 [Pseudomonas aeruginosa]|nr:hypothetical protein [Pseudomonas aeruginosa]MDV6647714.1 hypothetical protein [Pseudomonas aeruginosa]MDV6925582.1 hypothetical protein [Pseudomonas aeruginosa]RWY09321.1 hypothetical protein EQH71_02840 [Pseudomonas aeruginosa]
MQRSATVHVHPACTSSPQQIQRLQADTGCLVVIFNGKAQLVASRTWGRRHVVTATSPFGGDAA